MNINNSLWFRNCRKCILQIRCTSKIAVYLDKDVLTKIDNESLKARNHPGRLKTGTLSVPKLIQNALLRATGDHPLKKLQTDGQKLSQYLNSRHPPPELPYIKNKLLEIETEMDKKYPPPRDIKEMSEVEITNFRTKRSSQIKKVFKQRVFAWKQITYGEYESLTYAIGRSAIEYAILLKILTEIKRRHSDFKPRSFFDFGSGVGTGMWAASSIWKESIFEYFNVDISRDMNDLSDLIIREGNENQHPILKNVYYRQFLPATDTKFDLVITSFSLFELKDKSSRLEVLLNLWRKCNQYLIIVEEGTKNAFDLVIEARNYLLRQNEKNDPQGYVFSPCPHDFACPRFANSEDQTPCNFEINYEPLSIVDNSFGKSKHLYNYVVLKKGTRESIPSDNWPRIVRPTLVRSKHSICRMCTSEGKLQEIVFTASKHGKTAYHCARSSKWGDRLPLEIGDKFIDDKIKYLNSNKDDDIKD